MDPPGSGPDLEARKFRLRLEAAPRFGNRGGIVRGGDSVLALDRVVWAEKIAAVIALHLPAPWFRGLASRAVGILVTRTGVNSHAA